MLILLANATNCQRLKGSEKIFLGTKGVGMSDIYISYYHDTAPIN